MSKANAIAVQRDDLGLDGRLEHVTIAAGDRRHERDGWLGKCCGSPERGASLRRQRGEPAAGELMHSRGYRQGLAGIERSPVTLERPGKLEREEGVAARALMDPPERRSREGGVEAVAEKSGERPEAEWAHPDAVHSLLGKSRLEVRAGFALAHSGMQPTMRSARHRGAAARTAAPSRNRGRAIASRR